MATAYELADSRGHNLSLEDASGELKYIVLRDSNETTIYNAVAAVAPSTLNGLVYKSIDLDPVGGGVWFATVAYGLRVGSAVPAQLNPEGPIPPPPPPAPPGETDALGAEWSFSTTGATQHITASLETKGNFAHVGEVAPNFLGAIGVDGDSVNGVDIVSRKQELSTTRTFSAVSHKYFQIVAELTGTINEEPYLGYAKGELLFLGAEMQYRSPEEGWVGTFRFLAGKIRASKPVAGIPISDVGPHDHVWFRYRPSTDLGVFIQRPVSAHVERVYEYGDFMRLKL